MKSLPRFSIDRLQANSFSVARLARRLASVPAAEEAFAAGMLHDVGKFILAIGMPERFSQTIGVALETRRPAHEVERELLGLTHAEVGAYLLGAWGLPFGIVEAVAHHHTPNRAPAVASETLTAVHVAAALIEWADAEQSTPGAPDALDLAHVERAGWTARLPQCRMMALEEVRSVADAA